MRNQPKTYSLPEASRRLKIPPRRMLELVRAGKIQVSEVPIHQRRGGPRYVVAESEIGRVRDAGHCGRRQRRRKAKTKTARSSARQIARTRRRGPLLSVDPALRKIESCEISAAQKLAEQFGIN